MGLQHESQHRFADPERARERKEEREYKIFAISFSVAAAPGSMNQHGHVVGREL